ncbi:MAG: TetR/AcrR family transcriptional regulator [Armatimonadota bacterium]|nr:TetR/AcrR family transcriptional regulator [bacterium]
MDSEESRQSASWRERRKQQLRDELVQVALKLFTEQGFDTPSVDDIVAGAGVAKGTFYLYFKTKAEIVQASLEHLAGELNNRIGVALEKTSGDAREDLSAAVGAHMAFLQDYPGLADRFLAPDAANPVSPIYERTLRKGMLQGCYREVDAEMAVSALQGMLHGLVSKATKNGGSLQDICELAVDLFGHGVKR